MKTFFLVVIIPRHFIQGLFTCLRLSILLSQDIDNFLIPPFCWPSLAVTFVTWMKLIVYLLLEKLPVDNWGQKSVTKRTIN